MFRDVDSYNAETKEHYKMYKAGKRWIFAGLFVAALGLGGLELSAKADDVVGNPQAPQKTVTAQTQVPASQAKSQVISAAQSASSVATQASSVAKQTVPAGQKVASDATPVSSQTQKQGKDNTDSSSAQSVQGKIVAKAELVSAVNSNVSQVSKSAKTVTAVTSTMSQVATSASITSSAPTSSVSTATAKRVSVKGRAVASKSVNLSFLAEADSPAKSSAPSNAKVVPVEKQTIQTKAYSVDPKTGQVAVDTNAIYDDNNDAIKPFSSAIYAPYDANNLTATTFGDQNTIDARDGVKAGRMLVKITDNQTSGFDVDVPIYGDENTGIDLSKYVGKYLRFKFSQAKQFIGIPVNPSDSTDVYTATLVDPEGKEIGPIPETEVSPIVTTPDIKLTDTQTQTSLNSNIFSDSPIADILQKFGLDKLSSDSLADLAQAEPSTKTYRKPVMQPNGQIVYQASEVPIEHFAVTIPVDPKSQPGTNDNSTSLTPYVPVHNFVTDPTTGKPTEVLIGYAKEDEYQNSGGLNYKLYDSPHDGATLLGTAVNGMYTPSGITQIGVQVTFSNTDSKTSTITLPATQTDQANTNSTFNYTDVIVPDMPAGYQLAEASKQDPAITVGTDAAKNNYQVLIEPISEPVSVTFTANNGDKGTTKAKTMGTNGTYTTNADYNSTFGKDKLASVNVPDGYSLDSVTPDNKVGLSGTNNYTATIAPKDETVALTYSNTDGKATVMAADAPTTASAKMDSTFGAADLTTKPTETGYSVATAQNPDITVGTTGNSYTLQYSPDLETINVSFVADNKNATIAALKVTGAVKANYDSTFGIKDVKALPGLPTFAGYDYAVKQSDDITVGTANNNYVVQLVAQDEEGTVQVIRSDDAGKTVQQRMPFTAKMDSTFGYAKVSTGKIISIPGYSLEAADKQATGMTIGTDASKNIYQVGMTPDAENVTLNLVKTNDSGKVFKSATASANMNSSYGITQAKADLTKLKLDVPAGYSLVADNKQAADETIKTTGNVYKVMIAPDAKTVTISVVATNTEALNIPSFGQNSAVDASFGYGDVDQTKFMIPAGYQLVSKDKQNKNLTVDNDEAKDTYQVLLVPKTNTKVTVKMALTQSGKQKVVLPAAQDTTATTDTKYTLADAKTLLGDKLQVTGYHVAVATEKVDPDVTVAGDGSTIFTVYLAPDSETLDFKFNALDNSGAADTLNAAKVSVTVPFNTTYAFTGHEKGLPALPTGYSYESYPSTDIKSPKSNTMTVNVQKEKQPVPPVVTNNQPTTKPVTTDTKSTTSAVTNTKPETISVTSNTKPVKPAIINNKPTTTITSHTQPAIPEVTGDQPITKPVSTNTKAVTPADTNTKLVKPQIAATIQSQPKVFARTIELLATVRNDQGVWSIVPLSSLKLNGLYGEQVTQTTPSVTGYTGESLKLTLNDTLSQTLLAYVGQEAHLAIHHYLIDANHHIVKEIGSVGNLFGTVGGAYNIPADQIKGYRLVSITGDPEFTVSDETTKGNAINLYYIKSPAQTVTTPANASATQPTVQIAPNEPNYVVTGTINNKPVSFTAQPVTHVISTGVQTQPAGQTKTTGTIRLSETVQSTTVKQSTPSVVLPVVQKVVKSSNNGAKLTVPQKPVENNYLRSVKTEIPTAMKHAQVLPQTNEQHTEVLGLVGAGLMSLLAALGISRKRRD